MTRQYAGDRRVSRNCLVGASDATAVCFPGKDFVVAVFRSRKPRTAAIVSVGFSSISQWPEFAIMTSVTLSAALRMMMATLAPNAFAAPTASTGMVSLVIIETLLSSTSLGIERNWAKAERMAPGSA